MATHTLDHIVSVRHGDWHNCTDEKDCTYKMSPEDWQDVARFYFLQEAIEQAQRYAQNGVNAKVTRPMLTQEGETVSLYRATKRCPDCLDVPGKDGLGRTCKRCDGAGVLRITATVQS